MSIAFIGAGGTGGYFGGLLARAGEEVSFLGRGTQLAALRTHGLTVKSRLAGTFSLPVQATSDPRQIGAVDLVLFSVKTYASRAASLGLHLLMGPETVVLPIQNGIDAAEQLGRQVGMQHLVGGVAYVTSPETSGLLTAVLKEGEALAQAHSIVLPDGIVERSYATLQALEPEAMGSMAFDPAFGASVGTGGPQRDDGAPGQEHGLSLPFNFAMYAALKPYMNGERR
jgi:ketopantoate reductase